MSKLSKISAKAPSPLMNSSAAAAFEMLRAKVRDGCGFDFLARLGDVHRPANFRTTKDGVANRSWHKTGRAFDYDQTCKQLVIVTEPRAGKTYFRTWLICAKQDGTQGEKKLLRDYRGGSFSGWAFDFTKAAESFGFERIPAWTGWQRNYNRREFWHYQKTDGLSWTAAMSQILGT